MRTGLAIVPTKVARYSIPGHQHHQSISRMEREETWTLSAFLISPPRRTPSQGHRNELFALIILLDTTIPSFLNLMEKRHFQKSDLKLLSHNTATVSDTRRSTTRSQNEDRTQESGVGMVFYKSLCSMLLLFVRFSLCHFQMEKVRTVCFYDSSGRMECIQVSSGHSCCFRLSVMGVNGQVSTCFRFG